MLAQHARIGRLGTVAAGDVGAEAAGDERETAHAGAADPYEVQPSPPPRRLTGTRRRPAGLGVSMRTAVCLRAACASRRKQLVRHLTGGLRSRPAGGCLPHLRKAFAVGPELGDDRREP